jgi:hypothetical protein
MHTIEVVVDRLVRRDDIRQRLTESIETALELTGGTAEVLVMNADGERAEEAITFSQHLACTFTAASASRSPPPELLLQLALRRLPGLPRPRHPLRGGPRAGRARRLDSRWPRGRWPRGPGPAASTSPACRRRGRLRRLLLRRPWKSLKAKDKKLVLYGTGTRQVHLTYKNRFNRQALLRGAVRGHRPVAAAPPRRGGVRLVPRADRGLHAGGRLPRVRRAPASSPSRWPSPSAGTTSSSCAACRSRRRSTMVDDPRALRARAPDRRPGLQGGARADAVPARRRAGLPLPGPLGRHPVGGRGPAHPPGQPDRQRRWSASSTSWTSRPSACTSATTSA